MGTLTLSAGQEGGWPGLRLNMWWASEVEAVWLGIMASKARSGQTA